MHIRILGSGAGGGFPQWNCNCENCKGLRTNTAKVKARHQSSITVSSNGEDWILFNASPIVIGFKKVISFSKLSKSIFVEISFE